MFDRLLKKLAFISVVSKFQVLYKELTYKTEKRRDLVIENYQEKK